MDKVRQSILAPAISRSKVIPNGVDLAIFRPSDKQNARDALGIPQDMKILLFAADGIKKNIWKDYATLRAALSIIAGRPDSRKVLLVALGESEPPEVIGNTRIQFVPYVQDESVISQYYQAADFYVHAARADTFPNSILESLACGTPVVATSVGGIPEQIIEGRTGLLSACGDTSGLASNIDTLLSDDDMLGRMGIAAAEDAKQRFGLDRMIRNYLDLYDEIMEKPLA
jgi:glycosyltransferase involved in cell wall biosynthesis